MGIDGSDRMYPIEFLFVKVRTKKVGSGSYNSLC